MSGTSNIGGPAISAIGGLVSSALGTSFASSQQDKAFRNQVELWKMNNEYNKPVNQKNRLLDAGINPYMAMTGDHGSQMASAPPPVSADMSGFNQGVQSVSDFFAREQQFKNDMELGSAAADKASAEAEGQRIDNKSKAAKNAAEIGKMKSETKSIDTRRALDEIEKSIKQAVQSDVIESYHLQNEAARSDIDLKRAQQNAIQLESELTKLKIKNAPAEFASQLALNAANAFAAYQSGKLSAAQIGKVAQEIVESTARTTGIKIDNYQKNRLGWVIYEQNKQHLDNLYDFGTSELLGNYSDSHISFGPYKVGTNTINKRPRR